MLKARYCAGTCVGALVICMSVPSQAAPRTQASAGSQETEAASPATASATDQDADAPGLQDIVVTAQKRSENLQRVPIAVIAASGEQLAASGVVSITQLAAIAPGVNIRVTNGSFQPSIRGITTSSSVVENPVALYIDGVYYPQQREGLRDLLDVEQIAVLKGPQGTLFGRNATGGVVQITTRTPSQTFEGEATASIDNYATFIGNIYVAGGLAENLSASLSAQFTAQGDGWGVNRSTGNDTGRILHNASVRAKLVFAPSEATTITLIGDYTDRDQYAEAFQPYPGTALSYPGLCRLRSKYDTCGAVDGRVGFHGGGVSLTVDHDFGFAKLLSISAYRNGNGSFQFDNGQISPSVFGVLSPDNPNESFTQELQLVSNRGGAFNWVAGAFYIYNANGNLPVIRLPSGPLAPAPTSATNNSAFATEEANSVAPFAQVEWEFLPRTKLTLGARYTYEKRTIGGRVELTRVNGTKTVIPVAGAVSIEKPSFRAALDHQLTDDILVYASVNTGFKSGGYNVIAPTNPPYAPETLTAYEGGFKSQLLEDRLRLNVAGFYYNYKNLQVTQIVNNVQTVFNGARARLYGVDIDVEAQLARGLRLTGGLEILDAKFDEFPGAQFGMVRPTGGAIISAGNAAGKRLPLAQDFSATGALDYDTDVSFGRLHYNLTANYNGRYFFEADNFLKQDAYVMLNTSLRWTSASDRFSVSVWGRNLLNEIVIERTSTQGQGYPTIYGFAPRTYGLTAGVKF